MKTLAWLILFLSVTAAPAAAPADLRGTDFRVEISVSERGAWTVEQFSHPQHRIDPASVRITPTRHPLAAGTLARGVYRIDSFATEGGLGTTRSGGRGRGRLVLEQIHREPDGWVRCGRKCPQDVPSNITIR